MAFVRVKRRLDEEPIEALLLAFKKRKVSSCVTPSGESSQKVENVFQFCGTLQDEGDNVFEVARSFREKSHDLKKDVKSRVIDHRAELSKQIRKEVKQEEVKVGRYKLVCHRRNANVDQDSESETEVNASLPNPSVTNAAIARHPSHLKLQLFDLVNESDVPVVKEETISLNGIALVKEPNAQPFDYVYDLYYNDAWNADDGFIDNLLSVQPYKQELYYGDYREEERADDDEDSNEENHYGNDYPSDEEYLRDGEDDDCGLGAAVKPWSLGDDSDEEDGLIYTRKASPVYSSYEAYKRRKQLEEQKDSEESDSD